MFLENISLTNFRNYADFSLDFAPLTILVGPNGIGKTNLMEAVYLLAAFSSYRSRFNKDLIKRGEDFARLVAETDKGVIELFLEQKNSAKKIKINQTERKTVEALGELVMVLFSPESLEIISGAPLQRRRFLNLILAQLDRFYAQDLLTLNQVLANRNHLLARINHGLAKEDELDFWDQQLNELNTRIVQRRQELIKQIKNSLHQYYQTISDSADELVLKYALKAEPEHLLDLLIVNRQQEIKQASTLYGPHRDDLFFYLNHQPFSAGWSRGELRSATLALKMSEVDYLQNKVKKPLVLLLDDVFSELDQQRRQKLLELIKNQQTIITTTDRDHLSAAILKEAKVVELDK